MLHVVTMGDGIFLRERGVNEVWMQTQLEGCDIEEEGRRATSFMHR